MQKKTSETQENNSSPIEVLLGNTNEVESTDTKNRKKKRLVGIGIVFVLVTTSISVLIFSNITDYGKSLENHDSTV